jgi:hypothetical protein
MPVTVAPAGAGEVGDDPGVSPDAVGKAAARMMITAMIYRIERPSE